MDTILFPLFEVPLMTEEIESALTGNLEDGQLFRDIWKGLFDSPDTVPLNIGKRNWNTQDGPSGRGQPFIYIEIRVAP